MKNITLIIGTALVLVSAGAYIALFVHAAEPKLAVARKPAGHGDDSSSASGEQVTDLREEVRRLQAEVNVKNDLIRVMAARPPIPEQQADPEPVATHAPHLDRVAQVCDALDERIVMASSDTADARAMKHALQVVVDSGALGAAQVTSLMCSGTLCKVALAGQSDADVGAAAAAMAERAPKMFAASMAYPAKPGELAMYLAKSQQDLAVDLDTEAID